MLASSPLRVRQTDSCLRLLWAEAKVLMSKQPEHLLHTCQWTWNVSEFHYVPEAGDRRGEPPPPLDHFCSPPGSEVQMRKTIPGFFSAQTRGFIRHHRLQCITRHSVCIVYVCVCVCLTRQSMFIYVKVLVCTCVFPQVCVCCMHVYVYICFVECTCSHICVPLGMGVCQYMCAFCEYCASSGIHKYIYRNVHICMEEV